MPGEVRPFREALDPDLLQGCCTRDRPSEDVLEVDPGLLVDGCGVGEEDRPPNLRVGTDEPRVREGAIEGHPDPDGVERNRAHESSGVPENESTRGLVDALVRVGILLDGGDPERDRIGLETALATTRIRFGWVVLDRSDTRAETGIDC
ncbi:hypothetical protein [Curtobacterium flaccumfaciens]|uniref:hypothetical protein n=1 Tax=Curtobacterium flaccumfaciens TaxID=2035 RepID=UPI001BDE7FA4|nr:hypothetical protein [Curtobacterium flaccumfaciens]MBT1632246.1 hypothetical protein [Curtobacterium flaccumfaciens pv. oortii]MCX2846402.1 hypothetical protein [Curtobacterium flaccumfaciens pv. oortii]